MKLGSQDAVVVDVSSAESGGAPAVAVRVRYEDGRIEQASLRADLVPAGLAAGDRVEVTKAALYRRWTIRRID